MSFCQFSSRFIPCDFGLWGTSYITSNGTTSSLGNSCSIWCHWCIWYCGCTKQKRLVITKCLRKFKYCYAKHNLTCTFRVNRKHLSNWSCKSYCWQNMKMMCSVVSENKCRGMYFKDSNTTRLTDKMKHIIAPL